MMHKIFARPSLTTMSRMAWADSKEEADGKEEADAKEEANDKEETNAK